MAGRAEGRLPERGQQALEFALVLPVLVLVVLGVLDLARAFFAAITITNAARVGARYGLAYPTQTDDIIEATRTEADDSGIDLRDTTIANIGVDCGTCASGEAITVTVTYTFTLITGAVLPNPEIPIQRSAAMLIP